MRPVCSPTTSKHIAPHMPDGSTPSNDPFSIANDIKKSAPFYCSATADSILEKVERLCLQLSGTSC